MDSQLGNLIELGRVTFAPNSTEVIALVDHLMTSTKVNLLSNHNFFVTHHPKTIFFPSTFLVFWIFVVDHDVNLHQ